MGLTSVLSSHIISSMPNESNYASDTLKDWNYWIKVQIRLKNDKAIISTYTQMESAGISPDTTTLPLILKACARRNAVDVGKRIHSKVKGTDLMDDVRIGTAMVDFYSKCGFLDEARGVFDQMFKRDLVSWNAMLSGYVHSGEYDEALIFFAEMLKEGLRPNSRTVVQLFGACEEMSDGRLGKAVHGYCLRNRLFDSDAHVNTALVSFYSSYDVESSRFVFDSMVMKNTISWNAMITGYLDSGDYYNALSLFLVMLQEAYRSDSVTMLVIIQACAEIQCADLGRQIHQMVIKLGFVKDLFLMNALLNMYSKLGSLEQSCKLFDSIKPQDAALWNSMISSYLEYGLYEEAMSLFVEMQTSSVRENEVTIGITLSICEEINEGLRTGKSFHAHTIKNRMEMDVSLGNALLSMYVRTNCIESAQKVFGEMNKVDVISYNTLISGLARNRFRTEALELFAIMQDCGTISNSYTIVSLLPFCDNKDFLNPGRCIHGYGIKRGVEMNVSLYTALALMYVECGDLSAARDLFECCIDKDLILWNSLIEAYMKGGQPGEALVLFNRMISEIEPNSVTVTSILSSCAHLSDMPRGKCLHAYVLRRKASIGIDLSVPNALITMYMRCGSVEDAEKIFRELSRRNMSSWKAMISGYGVHGRGQDAVQAFLAMLEEGFQPNGATFLAVLAACCRSGLVESGLKLFHSMVHDFNIEPEMAHYGCVVDLLGRAGELEKAREFIDHMRLKPDASVWRSLISACRGHCDTERATVASEKLLELEPTNPGNYILLSNIYAEAGLWSEVRKIRAWLRDRGLKKPPGSSWIIIGGETHSFTLGDTSHPSSKKVYEVLSSLMSVIRGIT